jgi:hypothetical protein
MGIRVKQHGDVLKIELPLEKPHLSKSGKTMLVASTYGVKATEVQYEGGRVAVVANAFIYQKKKTR